MKRLAPLLPLLFASISSAAPLYSVIDLGTLGGARSVGNGVNDLGQVTGTSAFSGTSTQHAFRYTPGVGMVDLGSFPSNASQSVGFGINNAGVVAGSTNTGGGAYAVRGAPGSAFTDLGNLGSANSEARAINGAGQIVGSSVKPGESFHAFRYTSATGLQDLGTLGGTLSQAYAINSVGQVIGSSTTAIGQPQAFRYTDGTGMVNLGALVQGTQSYAFGVNDSGQTTGFYRISSGGYIAYLYTDGDTTLRSLGKLANRAYHIGYSVNNAGFVVGNSSNSSVENGVAFLSTTADGMLDLNTLVDGSGAGWNLQNAQGISNTGYITGFGTNPAGQTHAFLLMPSTVPEPTTVAGLALGLVAIARRRRKSA